jgi:PPOX class probable F420-dependent enzyme
VERPAYIDEVVQGRGVRDAVPWRRPALPGGETERSTMGVRQQLERLMNRGYDRMRDPAAFKIRADDAITGSFDTMRGRKYAVLVTFRRNGDPVPSPVWFGLDDAGRAYVQTGADSGKVKRIRNDGRVVIAPSDVRGRPKAVPVRGIARVVPKDEWSHAEDTLADAYGLGRKLYEGIFVGSKAPVAYIEVTPEGAGS